MKIKFSHVLLYNFINAEKKSMLSKWSHCDDQVKVQSSAQDKDLVFSGFRVGQII